MIVHAANGAWGAFEVKLGSAQEDKAAKNLVRLEKKLTERGEQPPAVKAVIVGVGAVAHTRDDGVAVIPLDTLAP